eukprot:scaffold126661_cov28-Tisochrysis_lutea.AAC.10
MKTNRPAPPPHRRQLRSHARLRPAHEWRVESVTEPPCGDSSQSSIIGTSSGKAPRAARSACCRVVFSAASGRAAVSFSWHSSARAIARSLARDASALVTRSSGSSLSGLGPTSRLRMITSDGSCGLALSYASWRPHAGQDVTRSDGSGWMECTVSDALVVCSSAR